MLKQEEPSDLVQYYMEEEAITLLKEKKQCVCVCVCVMCVCVCVCIGTCTPVR